MKIRFFNAKIADLDEFTIYKGELIVEDGLITYAGPSYNGASALWDREIDANGNLLLPGFKNAHTHTPMTFLRSHADDLPLQEWLHQVVFPMEAQLKSEDMYWLSKLAIMESLTSGITTNFDMYFHPDVLAKASVECGFRTVFCGTVNGEFSYEAIEQLKKNFLELNNYHELIGFQLGFHAEYSTSRDMLEAIADLAQKYHAPVFSHHSETKREVEDCIKRNQKTPTKYLFDLGLFAYGGGGHHCNYMTEEDLDIFLSKNMSVITNPASNAKLASGIAPLVRIKEKGINLGIGTDGVASNNCMDMFREMFLATALQKLKEENASALGADYVLRSAVEGSAKAMGLENCISLKEGNLADLIMIDLSQPNMQPVNHMLHNLVYSGSKQNVKLTMINGKILYEDGAFYINAEQQEIYQKCNEIIRRIEREIYP